MFQRDKYMTDRYPDHEELRPIGEATHIPDQEITSEADVETEHRGIEDKQAGYPDRAPEMDVQCRLCRTSIPANRTKCRFCLTNQIKSPSDGRGSSEPEWAFLHVVFAIVEASTYYEALAKGSTATALLAKADSDPAIDNCQLIYDVAEEPATQLTRRWGPLPPAVRVQSDCGQQLLETACN